MEQKSAAGVNLRTWGGWTEKRWIKTLKDLIETDKYTTGHKTQWCYEKKRYLEASGEWDYLPIAIKYNLQFYAFLNEKRRPE